MKTYQVAVRDVAYKELQAAADYYEEEQPGLGTRFEARFYKEMLALASAPYTRAIRYGNIRFALLTPFKEAVHYWIDEEASTIRVVAVISQYRDPETTWNREEREQE